MARDYTAVPWEYLDEMDELTDEEFGRLIRALLRYSRNGEVISPSGNERFYVKRVMNREDRYQENYGDLSDVRSEAGKKGANARWNGKNMANDSKNGKAIVANGKNGYTETKAKANTETNPNIHTPLTPQKGGAFEKFWAVYPKKVGKQAAYRTWSRLKPNAELTQTILKAVEYQRSTDQWQKENGRFIPNPATWLNQGRWEDEVTVLPVQTEEKPVDEGDLDWLLAEMAVRDA